MKRRERRTFPAWIYPSAPSNLMKDVGLAMVIMGVISAVVVVIRHLFE